MLREERRSESRQKMMMTGYVFLQGGGVIECFLTDWSRGGARLLLSSTTNIGDEIRLECAFLKRRREATVVWRSETELGVTFRAHGRVHREGSAGLAWRC